MIVEVSRDSLNEAHTAGVEALEMAESVQSLTIRDNEHYSTAATCLRQVKDRHGELDAQRKAIKKPILEAGRQIDSLFKPALTALKKTEGVIKKGMGDFQQEILRKQAEAAAAVAAAAAADKPVEEVRDLLSQTRKTEVPQVEGISTRMVTKFEITDESVLPRYLLTPDMVKIRGAVKSGAEVPGVRIWREPSIAARSN